MKWYKDWMVWTMLIIGSPFLFVAGYMMYSSIFLLLTGDYPKPPLK